MAAKEAGAVIRGQISEQGVVGIQAPIAPGRREGMGVVGEASLNRRHMRTRQAVGSHAKTQSETHQAEATGAVVTYPQP